VTGAGAKAANFDSLRDEALGVERCRVESWGEGRVLDEEDVVRDPECLASDQLPVSSVQ